MKAIGIVRRIDDLGRVVIPREIRRAMGIKDGDPLEVFIEDDKVCFAPYNTSVCQRLKNALPDVNDYTVDDPVRPLLISIKTMVEALEKIENNEG